MKYCRIVSCQNARGSSVHMFRYQRQWDSALMNIQCTRSNLVCIEHFQNEAIESKANKHRLKESAIPTIFTEFLDEEACSYEKSESNCEKCENFENEIQFLRQCLAQNEKTEETLRETIEKQSKKLGDLQKEIYDLNKDLKEFNDQFDSDLARFAVDSNSKVSFDSPQK